MSQSIQQPTLDEIEEQVWKQVRRDDTKKTAERYERVFQQFLDFIESDGLNDVLAVSKLDVKDYIRWLLDKDDGRGLAGKTVGTYRSAVWRFFDELPDIVERRGYDINLPRESPAEDLDIDDWNVGVRTQKAIEGREKDDIIYISPEDKEKLVNNAGSPEKRNILMIRLLWQTGLRRSEIVDIRLSDMSLTDDNQIIKEERSINVRTAKKKDTDKDAIRTVWWQPSLDNLIQEYLDVYRHGAPMADESRYLFPGVRQEALSGEQVNYVIQRSAERASIQEDIYTDKKGNVRKKYSAHSMRHSHGVQSIKNNVNVRFLQKEMGHSSIETTEIYMKIANKDIKNEFRKKGPGTESP